MPHIRRANHQGLLISAILALLPRGPKPISHYLKKHFGHDLQKHPIIRAEFNSFRLGCVHLALEHYIASRRRRTKIFGVSGDGGDAGFNDLIHPESCEQFVDGPVRYTHVALANGQNLSCANRAAFLISEGTERIALLINYTTYDEDVSVEVMAKDRRIAERFLSELQTLVDSQSIYRGHTITMKEEKGDLKVAFHNVPFISRDQLILPDEVINQIERHTGRFSMYRDLLASRGRHLKRGLLLHGPPGTGKSLTIMYLIGMMSDRTTILLNGNAARHLEDACALARSLQPATVVIDDVDLVAEERTSRNFNPLMFELLNQMDGIGDDADVLFLLTTNRPAVLEPAIAERPGRIDQAVMIPLPDEDCRAKLFDLYGKGLQLDLNDRQRLIELTANVSAAFIRELFRKAALIAIEEGVDLVIQDRHFEIALSLLQSKNSLTGRFLGSRPVDTDPDRFDTFDGDEDDEDDEG
jgi:ATPase family associated with various cellular activities (AAA)